MLVSGVQLLVDASRLFYGWRQKQDNNNNKTRQDLAELEASLAPAEAEFGAVAKADQNMHNGESTCQKNDNIFKQCQDISLGLVNLSICCFRL